MKTSAFLTTFCCLLCHVMLVAQPPLVNGWTPFLPSADTRIIYVSDSDGDDFTAHFYMPDDVAVGSDPFLPTGSIQAFKTIAAGMTQLRNGFPDWILLKKGDVFQNQHFGIINLSGRNSDEPVVFSSYGTSDQRPQIHTAGQPAISIGYYFDNNVCNDLAFCGLHLDPSPRPTDADPSAIQVFADFNNLLFEDIYVSYFFTAVVVLDPAGGGTASRSNLTIRRSAFCDSYTTGTAHTGGVFINNVDSILFEENLVDRNGWSDAIPGATANGFRHNTYFQVGNKNLTFRDNISSRASATGGGHRCGGIITGNLYLSNPQNLQFGTHETTINWPSEFVTGEVAYNVVLDSRVEPFDPGRGIRVQRAKNVQVHHNIVAHFTSMGTYNLGMFLDEAEDVEFNANIIYKWGNNMPTGPAYSSGIALGSGLTGMNVMANNAIQMENEKGYCFNTNAPFANVSFSENKYYNVNPQNNWFQPGGNFTAWSNMSGETGGQVLDVPYSDPERNISSYLATLGIVGDLDELISLRKAMNKSNWSDNFTAQVINNYIREGFDLDGPSAITLQTDTNNRVNCFPNPTTNILHIQSREHLQTIHVFSTQGINMMTVETVKDQLELDVHFLPPGMYFLQIILQNGDRVLSTFTKQP
ncbi:MAG: T9SS type A sorting domain-containing protein [Saprospiraceae bacterium]|nr:T9SS type A sorting domain-containing protein [Saprospiraceae bacterium]